MPLMSFLGFPRKVGCQSPRLARRPRSSAIVGGSISGGTVPGARFGWAVGGRGGARAMRSFLAARDVLGDPAARRCRGLRRLDPRPGACSPGAADRPDPAFAKTGIGELGQQAAPRQEYALLVLPRAREDGK
jgi:hypothetical protein